MNFICLRCGRFGHFKEGCKEIVSHSKEAPEEQHKKEETVGSNYLWIMVQKNMVYNQRIQPPSKGASDRQDNTNDGSRYNALATTDTTDEQDSDVASDTERDMGASNNGEHNEDILGMNGKLRTQKGGKRATKRKSNKHHQSSSLKEQPRTKTSNVTVTSKDNKDESEQPHNLDNIGKHTLAQKDRHTIVHYEYFLVIDSEGTSTLHTQELHLGEHHEDTSQPPDKVSVTSQDLHQHSSQNT